MTYRGWPHRGIWDGPFVRIDKARNQSNPPINDWLIAVECPLQGEESEQASYSF